MPDATPPLDDAGRLSELLAESYGLVTQTVERLSGWDFLKPTRALGWTVQDLLFHLLLDGQRALAAFASTTSAEPTQDAVGYWRPWLADRGEGALAHAQYVRRSAASYGSPDWLVAHWRDTAQAAVRAARGASSGARVENQGHVMAVPDLLSTLIVEATVHYLDLTLELDAPPPSPAGLRHTRVILDGLVDDPAAAGWPDEEYLLKATGRVPLDGPAAGP